MGSPAPAPGGCWDGCGAVEAGEATFGESSWVAGLDEEFDGGLGRDSAQRSLRVESRVSTSWRSREVIALSRASRLVMSAPAWSSSSRRSVTIESTIPACSETPAGDTSGTAQRDETCAVTTRVSTTGSFSHAIAAKAARTAAALLR